MQRELPFKGITRPDASMINAPLNAEGNTYLHELCFRGASAEQVREAVVKHGADMQALNRRDLPPLGLAIIDGNLEAARGLIECGAELYFPVGEGAFFNAAAMAVFWCRADMLELILKNGGGLHVNQPTGYGLSCLSLAVEKGYPSLLAPLAEAGAFIDEGSGKEGLTPLQRAAEGSSPHMLEKLVLLGARLEKLSPAGMTALHHAVLEGSSAVVDRLLKLGADPDAMTAGGLTPLMLAADRGESGIIAMLTAAKADPNLRSAGEAKETALHRAASGGSYSAVSALLQGGADPLLTDAFNRTAARRARDNGNYQAASRLEEAERGAEHEFFNKAYDRLRKRGP